MRLRRRRPGGELRSTPATPTRHSTVGDTSGSRKVQPTTGQANLRDIRDPLDAKLLGGVKRGFRLVTLLAEPLHDFFLLLLVIRLRLAI